MTTTPGAVRGILAAGARKHSTPRATAPQRTTTLLTDVRTHPAQMLLPLCLLLFLHFQVHEPFLSPDASLSLSMHFLSWVGSPGMGLRVSGGHGRCRRGGLLRWKDVDVAEHLLLNLRWASGGSRCGLSLLWSYLIAEGSETCCSCMWRCARCDGSCT